jgi:hypothetical protein
VHDVASSQQRAVAIDDVVALSDAVQVSRVLGEFPKPDPSLPTEGSVAYELRLRWRAQREGRERLSGACYAIPTWLESNLGGNRDKAAARLSVDKPVLAQSASSRRGKIPCTDGRTGRQEERPDRSRKQRSSGWRLSRRASSDGRPSTKRKCLPSRKSLWPIYHRYLTHGHHRCVPQDGSDQGQRRWLLIEGLFAAVQSIRKPVASLQIRDSVHAARPTGPEREHDRRGGSGLSLRWANTDDEQLSYSASSSFWSIRRSW